MTGKQKPKNNDQKKDQKKKVQIRHFFYKSEDMIPYNLLHKWFQDEETVRVVLRTRDRNGDPFYIVGKILCMEQYSFVIENLQENKRVVFKHDVSSIRLENEEEKDN